MNVTSGIVKNRSKQALWLRESYDHGWKEEWKRLPCNNCRGSFWGVRQPGLPSAIPPQNRCQPIAHMEVAHFPFSSIISGVLDRFTDLRVAFFAGGVG